MNERMTLTQQILERLRPLEPDQVILFGSHAWGTPGEESDVDIYVVTKDDFIPKDFEQKKQLRLKVARAIRDLQKTTPIDVITHTRAMHKKFIENDSGFCRAIMQNGVRLL
nr:nucleotidyltransferase domain-containing protein [Desulfonatronum thioautotrophicum]